MRKANNCWGPRENDPAMATFFLAERLLWAEAVSKRAPVLFGGEVDPPERSVSASWHFGKGKVTPENRWISSFDTASARTGLLGFASIAAIRQSVLAASYSILPGSYYHCACRQPR